MLSKINEVKMKKIAIAALAVSTLGLVACGAQEAKAEGAAAVESSPYVGMERWTSGDVTFAYIGTDITAGKLSLGLQADLEAQNDQSQDRGELTKLNIDAAFAVTEDFSVYAENDLNNDFDRTETKVGFKYNF
jgi:hypothetical protein